MTVTPATIANAGADLRTERITADEFRAIMTAGRRQHSEIEWERTKLAAVALEDADARGAA